jgi:glutathione S-transferase
MCGPESPSPYRPSASAAIREGDLGLGDRSLLALSTLLGNQAYLMGDAPCGVGATAFGALAGATTPFFDSGLQQRAETYFKLTAYVDRMMRRYYPEHPW